MTFKSILETPNIQLIHVGKCAGSSLKQVLEQNSVYFKKYHSRSPRPSYNKYHKYIITVRDPVDRIVSALNWRYYLLVTKKKQGKSEGQKITLELELSLLSKIKDVDHFAKLIQQNTNEAKIFFELIGHLKRGLHWHCKNLLPYLNSAQTIGIIRTDHFESDISQQLKLQNFESTKEKSNYPKLFGKPSEDARQILKNYLTKDYQCLDHLERLRSERLDYIEANYS